jgi:hypothetical protein
MNNKGRGRPKELHGPLVVAKVPAITAVQIEALAKVKGQSKSEVVRNCLTSAMEREWRARE